MSDSNICASRVPILCSRLVFSVVRQEYRILGYISNPPTTDQLLFVHQLSIFPVSVEPEYIRVALFLSGCVCVCILLCSFSTQGQDLTIEERLIIVFLLHHNVIGAAVDIKSDESQARILLSPKPSAFSGSLTLLLVATLSHPTASQEVNRYLCLFI